MVNEVVDNIYLVNAPAGSGKTTKIKSMILNHTIKNPNDNILCITFTNRAADELKKDTKNKRVYFSTIHSFLHNFLGIYFSHTQVVELYFEIYGKEIQKRILNEEGNLNVIKSNERYIEKNGILSYEAIRKNLKSVYYNESPFNSLYYGGLSHDELISFAKIIFDRFPVVKIRLTKKFQIIFIDEYQDSSANVLKLFYDAVYGTSSKLYFLGDKMQQIYKNYDGTFEDKLSILNKSIALKTNYRSIPQVIDILNKLYNNELFKQISSSNNINILPDHPPRIIICDNISEKLESEKINYPNALLLFLLNQKRFDTIGSGNLFRQLGRMERYSFVQQYSAVDVLIDNTQDNPDPLIKLLFTINQISEDYANLSLGSIIQLFKRNPKIFDNEVYSVIKHEDKSRLNNQLKLILEKYNDTDGHNDISSILTVLKETGLVKSEYIDAITDSEEYSTIMNIKIREFSMLAKYLKTPNVSTQHGVKGESHDTVFFIAEDSTTTPVVHMYRFFKLWSTIDVSLNNFESFYYEYVTWINSTTQHLGFKLSDINSQLHGQHQQYLIAQVHGLLEYFKGNIFFKHLCEDDYIEYLSNPIVKTAKKCFKESQVYGALCAYRLFYVGCSRARRNLTVFIDKSRIEEFSLQLIEKFKATGFNIVN